MLGNNKGAMNPRMAGVLIATTGNGTRGTPQKLQGVTRAEVVLAQYTDLQGQVQAGLFFKIGDTYYATNDTEAWCKSLKPMAGWLQKQVDDALAQKAPTVLPEHDSVDVLGTGD